MEKECEIGEFGRYDKMVFLKFPDFMLKKNDGYYQTKAGCSIDRCMIDEIKNLWSEQVHTMGCCCGHNIDVGIVNVLTNKDKQKMISLGYKLIQDEPITFKAKSSHV